MDSLLTYSLLVPLFLYLLVSFGFLPAGLDQPLMFFVLIIMFIWGLWKQGHGVVDRDARGLANGITFLAWGILFFLQTRGLFNSTLLFCLLLFFMGLSWLMEWLLQKRWEKQE